MADFSGPQTDLTEFAKARMQQFGRDMAAWNDTLHDDVVIELPFGPSTGIPARTEGKAACSAMFEIVSDAMKVRFFDVVAHPMADAGQVLVEYKGYSERPDVKYDQSYICIQKFRDGKLILFKEYYNSMVMDQAFGRVSF